MSLPTTNSPDTTLDSLGSAAARATLRAHPSRGYVQIEPPVEPMPRLSKELGGAVELFVKRDDLLPLAGGGSKTRKLDYLVQQAPPPQETHHAADRCFPRHGSLRRDGTRRSPPLRPRI